jgi:hypothetical protein
MHCASVSGISFAPSEHVVAKHPRIDYHCLLINSIALVDHCDCFGQLLISALVDDII